MVKNESGIREKGEHETTTCTELKKTEWNGSFHTGIALEQAWGRRRSSGELTEQDFRLRPASISSMHWIQCMQSV